MRQTHFRNTICAFGLIFGTALIASADMAYAEVLPCTEEQMAGLESADGLPVICERMIVTGTRRQDVVERLRNTDFADLTPFGEIRDALLLDMSDQNRRWLSEAVS